MRKARSRARTQLSRYRAKRDFTRTAEPSGEGKEQAAGASYLIQKHAARRLHFDFRLELDGVLKSWAVTRGPSLNPEDKRLAVHVEDHPLGYGSFEGTIPQGQYGGGTVMLWDTGSWEPKGDAKRDYARGNLTFNLKGKRLQGRWHLVRLRGGRGGDAKRDNWLLIKGRDEFANSNGDAALEKYQTSVVSRRSMEAIAKGAEKTRAQDRRRAKSVNQPEDSLKAKGTRVPPKKAQQANKAPGIGRGSSPPAFIAPQLATLVSAPPEGTGWVHEIKFDGYRLLAVVEGSNARLFTRAGNDWSDRFPALCKALAKLQLQSAVIDGEAVISGADGSSSFHALQDALARGKLERLRYYAFDLLQLNGVDLRSRPLIERKALLEPLLRGSPDILDFSQHFAEPGDQMLAHACDLALEGIVSKESQAPYRSGRTSSWLKSKCIQEQEFVIGGYTEQPKHPGSLGALLVGYYEKEALHFAGKVGTGFTTAEGAALLKQLEKRNANASPFASVPSAARRGARFVQPELVAHVNFGEWTPDGKLRHASFQGLREDKPAREVTREKAKSVRSGTRNKATPSAIIPRTKRVSDDSTVAGITITHPERVLWPDGGITKLELARYYAAIAPKLLAYAGNRPISLVRCPRGPGHQCFFQRHAGDSMPPQVREVKVAGHGEGKPYLYIDDAPGLVSLVQMGTIEVYAWNATAADVKKPDRIIFDLDPGPEVAWDAVKDAAADLREGLKKLRLTSFLKTTGGKGLHVLVPFALGPNWAEAKNFARSFCAVLAQAEPQRFTINNRKDVRRGRIFLDYLRNDETASAIAAYSVRVRSGAPVSLPIAWKELANVKSGDAFKIADALNAKKDPWADLSNSGRQRLPTAQN